MIESRTNQKLKKVRKLISSAKERKETGLFVAEGVRFCSEAPPQLVDSVFVSEDCKAEITGSNVEIVEKNIFRELSDTVNPQGVLTVLRQPQWKVDLEEPDSSGAMILLLDGIRDPGNLGTIIRTAEAAGVKAVFMSPDCVDLYNPKVTRSTMGSIFRVPVVTADLLQVIDRLKASGIKVYGTSLAAVRSFRDIDFTGSAIIIGNEANGISEPVLAAATENIKIPMAGRVESLNAAISAAIVMFCSRRA